MRTITNTLQESARSIGRGEIEIQPGNRTAMVLQLRSIAARLQEDAVAVLRVANKLSDAQTVHQRMVAADQAVAVLDSVLVDVG